MQVKLIRHAGTPSPLRCAAVAVLRAGCGDLWLHYRLEGACRLPPPVLAHRADGLWRHTCCEAFVRGEGEAGYREFNFSPSRAWAAYRFDGYRRGMRALRVPPPAVMVRRAAGGLSLYACVRRAALPAGPWRMNLSAVVEDQAGGLSYWALKHPPGRPDFHHPDCFALRLAPLS